MTGPAATAWTLAQVRQKTGVSRATLAGLMAAGLVRPARGPRGAYRFSFQDVVLIRTAQGLQAEALTPRRIVEALRRLRTQLPDEIPLTGIRVSVLGRDVVVQDGNSPWEATTGQRVLAFAVEPAGPEGVFLPVRGAAGSMAGSAAASSAAATMDAAGWFARGQALEATDAAGAEAAYREALRQAPDLADAWLNLGALLCEHRRFDEAADLYGIAVAQCPDEPLLYFNRAIALEDLGREAEAAADYERCLALDDAVADAHYNLSRLHERHGDSRKALRHLNAYRRLSSR